MTQEDNKPAETWWVEYRNDGDGPMRFADGSIVCLIKDGPHSVVAYDVAEPDANRIVSDHAKAMLADELPFLVVERNRIPFVAWPEDFSQVDVPDHRAREILTSWLRRRDALTEAEGDA